MRTVRAVVKKFIQNSLRSLEKSGALLYANAGEFRIEYPEDAKLGDYSTNVAFLLARNEKKKPFLIAEMLAEKIASDPKAKKMFEKVEAAGAGFVNVTLSQECLHKQLGSMRDSTPHINIGRGKKLNIEFLSANPTGKFQVGNGRGGFYGDVLGNILRLAGYSVVKEYYINNAKNSNQIRELGKTALGQGEKYLTEYVEGKIQDLAKQFTKMAGSDPAIFGEAGFLLANEIHKENKKFLEEKAGIIFDIWTEEEELYKKGLLEKTFEYLKKKGVVYEKEGAQWLKTTKFGDDKDKVLVRSSGEYGYYLADIAYHWDKMKRGYKVIVDVFGADHQGHVRPIKIAMQILGFRGKFNVVVSQLVQAKGGGKFSKRAGNVILLEELIREVGVDASRFFYLMKSQDTQMEFDMDLAKEQSAKNPVYYVQYAHARMASILRKAGESYELRVTSYELLSHLSELNLIKYLIRWPEAIEDTANDYQVQRITSYATDLATFFSQFYRDCRVISEDEELARARLALVVLTQRVLKEALEALGVSAPNKM